MLLDLPSFIAGSAATLLGFLLTMAWDCWKMRQAKTEQRRRFLLVLRTELEENHHRALENVSLFRKRVDEPHLLVPPLLLKDTAWRMVEANAGLDHLRHDDLQEVMAAYYNISLVNRLIQSREALRMSSVAVSRILWELDRLHNAISRTPGFIPSTDGIRSKPPPLHFGNELKRVDTELLSLSEGLREGIKELLPRIGVK